MEIKLKYNIDDYVWIKYGSSYSFEVECLFCNYTGKVKLENGSTMPCGICSGSKKHLVHKSYKIRPLRKQIKGFYLQQTDKHKSFHWLDEYGHYLPDEIYDSFYAARKSAQKENKKYGWPDDKRARKERDDRPFTGHLEYPHRVYWGKRVRNNKHG